MTSTSRTTTLLGGLGLAFVAALELLPMVLNWLPVADTAASIFSSAPAQGIRVVALLASCVLLAFGFRREIGIVGPSPVGRIALLVAGLAFPLQSLVALVFLSGGAVGTAPGVIVGTSIEILPSIALAVAAVTVVRARVVEGLARWALLAVAAAQLLLFALAAVQNASQGYYLVVLVYGAALPPLLLAVAGTSLAISGRSIAFRQRLQTVHSHWRMSTSVS